MSQNSADSQVTSEAVLDSSTSLIILGAVLGSLFGITVLSILYYFCINCINKDKKDKEQDSASLYEERVDATTFAKNLGTTETIALDMDGIFGWTSPQSKDNYEASIASTPDMFQCSPNRSAKETQSISSSIGRASANSSVIAPPVTKSVTPSGVYYSFSMEADRDELEGGDEEEASGGVVSNVNEDGPTTEQVSMQSSPGCPGQVVTAASVYKPPKQTSMSRLVLERTISYLRRNQVEGSLTSDTYFQSSFNNLPDHQGNFQSSFNNLPDHQGNFQSSFNNLPDHRGNFQSSFNNLPNQEPILEGHQDQLNSSSERLKHILEKDDGLENEPIKCEDSSDSVFFTEYDDMPSVKQTNLNHDNSSMASPITKEIPTDDSLEKENVSKDYQNETSSSFSFEALAETPEGVSKELDWDSSHEPLQTRKSVLKLVCTPNPTKSKWSKDSPIKPSDALEDSIVDGLAHEILDELEWDNESPQGTKLTASFQITATRRPFSRAGKLSHLSGKSSDSSFTSAMSVGRTPFFSRLHKPSCTDYSTAEEDLSNNSNMKI